MEEEEQGNTGNMIGIGVYSHTLLNSIMSLVLSCFLFPYSPTPTLLFLFIYFNVHVLIIIPLLCYSCMFIVLLSYSHAHAPVVLLQFPIPDTSFNSLLSYPPLLMLLLSCRPVLLLAACLLSYSCFSNSTPSYSYSLNSKHSLTPGFLLVFSCFFSSIPSL